MNRPEGRTPRPMVYHAPEYSQNPHMPQGQQYESIPRENEGQESRKRARKSTTPALTAVDDGGDAGKKRARGRPRLDTKDESAHDRRRTQIRLAQRAYRSRKESAIADLEQTVNSLRDSNKEMLRLFQDLAANAGLQTADPELTYRIRSTTARFNTLNRSSDDDSSDSSQDPNDSRPHDEHRQASSHVQTTTSYDASSVPVTAPTPVQTTVPPTASSSRRPSVMPAQQQFIVPQVTSAATVSSTPAFDYEFITMPTAENASFAFGHEPQRHEPSSSFNTYFQYPQTTQPQTIMGPQMSLASQMAMMPHQHQQQFMQVPTLPSPYAFFDLPDTFSFQETTFARRLHRYTMERGWLLINMANPPQDIFTYVYGFQALFETIELIKTRLWRTLLRTTKENLHYWQAPYWSIGKGVQKVPGYPDYGLTEASREHGVDIMKPMQSAGFGMGPFDVRTTEAAKDRIDSRGNRIVMPGMQGDYLDPEQVEIYMLTRGVMIPPDQDVVSAAIDPAAFSDVVQPVKSTKVGEDNGKGKGVDYGDMGPPEVQGAAAIGHSIDYESAEAKTLAAMPKEPHGVPENPYIPPENPTVAFTVPNKSMTHYNMSFNTPAKKKMIVLDVNVFVAEMANRSTCLGRCPGIRAEEINASFWVAAKDISIEAY